MNRVYSSFSPLPVGSSVVQTTTDREREFCRCTDTVPSIAASQCIVSFYNDDRASKSLAVPVPIKHRVDAKALIFSYKTRKEKLSIIPWANENYVKRRTECPLHTLEQFEKKCYLFRRETVLCEPRIKDLCINSIEVSVTEVSSGLSRCRQPCATQSSLLY